ncbi:sensor histidine kinase [Marinoscillum pacificum]|uniref:sensor histidine kinase n=1 Tax=Marinoscillum pacificum TaxID=392723 RepID=UPI002157B67E|nr:HAMP domain-containing sensor histidine kinase [Marinoscillum pacificum]
MMNIKQTLTVRFILVFTVLWIAGALTIYWSFADFRKEEFYQRLHTKAITAAKLLIEVEEVDALLLKKIESANTFKLPGERLTIYDFNNEEIFTTDSEDSIIVDIDRFNDIRINGDVQWKQGEIEVLGILYTDQFDRFVVISSGQDTFGYRKLDYLSNVLALVFVLAVFLIAIAARIYAGKALKPFAQVIEEVGQIGVDNLSQRLDEGKGKDEIARLRGTFNKMLGRLQAAFDSQKSFIANASHELRTPMTSILSQVDVILLKERESEEYIHSLSSIKEDVRELAVLAERLLLLARIDAFKETFVPVRLDSLIWQATSDLSKQFSNQIVVDLSPDIDDERFLMIQGSEQLLRSVVVNVLENACKYSDNEVRVTLSLEQSELVLTIADEGIGIDDNDLAHISEPFFRGTNTQGFSGSGIGLNLVKKIIDIHDGQYFIRSSIGIGTSVKIFLPYKHF